jgi:AraC-like DNA-binding protein
MPKNINVMFLDNDFSKQVYVKNNADGSTFQCTSSIAKIVELIRLQRVDFIVVSDNFVDIDLVAFQQKLSTMTVTSDIPLFLYTKNLDPFYKKNMISGGYVDVLHAPMELETIYFNLAISSKVRRASVVCISSRVQQKQKLYAEHFGLQQKLPRATSVPSRHYNIVMSVIEIIKSKPAGSPTMVNLEATLCISAAQINSAFMICYHCSMFAWIREEKLLVAKSLVINGFGSINEIANRLGYADSPHFSRTFKARFGCSPKRMQLQDFAMHTA